MSREFTDNVIGRLMVPTPSMGVDNDLNMFKRKLDDSRDFVSAITDGVQSKRLYTGRAGLEPLRATLASQLADSMNVIDTGYSTTDAQSDEMITQPIAVKAFAQRWQQDYVEMTPLFCASQEPTTSALNMHTVASPQVLNMGLELKAIFDQRAPLEPSSSFDDMEDLATTLASTQIKTAVEFGDKWNYLGPMTGFLDAGVHSSDATKRAAQNAERMLTFSIFKRARIFNFFGEDLVKGDYLFWQVGARDMSFLRNFVDPRGQALAARRKLFDPQLQIFGASQRQLHTPVHNSSYDFTGDAFTNPRDSDVDYMQRIERLARDFDVIEFDDVFADAPRLKYGTGADKERQKKELLEEVPSLVYDAYMEGYCMKVGYARSLTGRAPTLGELREAHRSMEAMKKLQAVTIYNL